MKYLKTYKIFEFYTNDRVRDYWMIGDLKVNVGDKVLEDSEWRMHPLPESQVPVEDGLYTLKYIPIDKTDIVIDGLDTRKVFDKDDYDGYQTETFNHMLENFDKLPPIIFEENNDGTYKHVDGHHRIIIAKELGRKEILAFIKEIDQSGEYVNSKPKPKFKKVKEFWMLNGVYGDESRWAYFYKGQRISKNKAMQVLNTGELEVTEIKFL